jgi:hypothetical protein
VNPTDEVDIIDRIALDLPIEVRAAYYRVMNYCRSLPENDEMLRVLRAMQFLTLLMRQVPERILSERERLEGSLSEAMGQLRETAERAEDYRSMIEDRLTALPGELVAGLCPERVAREINESLRQQFVQSTIPQTAQAMSVVAAQLQAAVVDFSKTAAVLNHAHRGGAEQARQAVESLNTTVSAAASMARQAAQELSLAFRRELRWSIYTLVSIGIALAFGAGMLYEYWLSTPTGNAVRAEPPAAAAPAKVRQRPAR